MAATATAAVVAAAIPTVVVWKMEKENSRSIKTGKGRNNKDEDDYRKSASDGKEQELPHNPRTMYGTQT